MGTQPDSGSTCTERSVDELAALVAEQARIIDHLGSRIDGLEAERASRDITPSGPGDGAGPVEEPGDVRTGRRQLLSLAGMAAAGAVAGTAVLASQATPAAAASGVFDGAPAVKATSPSLAVEATATGVEGTAVRAFAADVGGVGVLSQAAGENGTAVHGIAAGVGGVGFNGTATGGYGVAVNGTVTGEESYGVLGTATGESGCGVYGRAIGPAWVGVRGEADRPGGVGIRGYAVSQSGNGEGVAGLTLAETGTGVAGFHNRNDGAGNGVTGISYSDEGIGVRAEAKVGVASLSNRTHMKLLPLGSWPQTPLDTEGARSAGELVFDGSVLWLCVASGTPGEWRSVAGPSTAGTLTVLDAAVRAYDSRPGSPPTSVTKGKLSQNQERTVDLRLGDGLPEGARAALINLTVTNTSAGGGFLKVFKPGSPVPTASAINWSSGGQNIANSATVAVTPLGELTVRCGGTGASTDFIIDVSGYYR